MKQVYSRPEISIMLIEPATMLALSDGGSVNVNQGEYAGQMSNQRDSDRSWGNLWSD